MQIRRSMPALRRIPAAEYGVTLGDFFFPIALGERLGARLQGLALAAAGALLIAASAQIVISLPGTPVPITGQTFGVLLVGASLGARRSIASLGLYLALGLVGAPVFRAGAHGLEQFIKPATDGVLTLAPTGGYLIGMLFAGWLVGRLADLGWDRTILGTIGAMLIGNAVIYAFGVPWLAIAIGADVATAIQKGLTPFLFGDALKIAIAAGVFPSAWWYVNHGRSAGPR